MKIGIVIPAFDEEASIGPVVERCRQTLGDEEASRIVVADNQSRDQTARQARAAGAEVVSVPFRGYGAACLGAVEHLGNWPDVLVFIDGDGSSRPEEIPLLLQPITDKKADLVLGVRPRNANMTPPQRWGTWLAVQGINCRWKQSFQDIGPFRAATRQAFHQLGMQDRTWGWTVEMQILALRRRLRILEVPVSWEQRIAGVSKISGTLSGVARAGVRILWTLARYGLGRA